MLDGLGNRICKGQYLYWKGKDVLVRVVEVSEATVIGGDTMPMLTVIAQVPVGGAITGKEVFVADMLRVVDPTQEARLDAAMTELPRRPQ